MPPNVLLVVLDAARADSLEPYGAPPGSSPTIARLAAGGAAHPRMFAPASWTLPSHASMLTGLLPRGLGLTQAPGGTPQGSRPVIEAQRDRLLPEVLRRAGYATAAVSANLWVSPHGGFDTGFERFVEARSTRKASLDGDGVRARLRWALEGVRARADDGAADAERAIRELLPVPGDGPFFWLVNLIECHSPYLPPRPYNDLSPRQRLLAALEARRHLTLDAIWRACAGGFDIPDAALERMRHLYRRSVLSLDAWLGRVLDALEGHGVLDDTLVIVTADHGENLGEDRLMAHAFSLDERLIRVPFVTSDPHLVEGSSARSLRELPRLLADHLELEVNPWAGDWFPDGVAVAQFDPLTSPDDPRLAQALEHWGLGSEALPRVANSLTCATDGTLKLLLRGEEELVFDLDADPLEARPLDAEAVASRESRLAPLRQALAHPAVWEVSDTEAPVREAAPSSDLEERMRLLGYL